MAIAKETVAQKIAAHLHHEIALESLVDWAENALMDGEFGAREAETICTAIARLGVADVRAFGLAWEDCERLLTLLGYTVHVEITAA
jgi:hypothetical protein